MSKYVILLASFFSFQVFASEGLNGKKLLLKYEGNLHYKVNFTKNTIHWECTQGDEIGSSETNSYQLEKISRKIYFIQWMETDGTFVALTLNLKTMRVISTGIYRDYKWFRKGAVIDVSTLPTKLTTIPSNKAWEEMGVL